MSFDCFLQCACHAWLPISWMLQIVPNTISTSKLARDDAADCLTCGRRTRPADHSAALQEPWPTQPPGHAPLPADSLMQAQGLPKTAVHLRAARLLLKINRQRMHPSDVLSRAALVQGVDGPSRERKCYHQKVHVRPLPTSAEWRVHHHCVCPHPRPQVAQLPHISLQEVYLQSAMTTHTWRANAYIQQVVPIS